MRMMDQGELLATLRRHGIHRPLGVLTGEFYLPMAVSPGQWRDEAIYGWLRGLDAKRAAAASVGVEV